VIRRSSLQEWGDKENIPPGNGVIRKSPLLKKSLLKISHHISSTENLQASRLH
jgi:hypothetical protein